MGIIWGKQKQYLQLQLHLTAIVLFTNDFHTNEMDGHYK